MRCCLPFGDTLPPRSSKPVFYVNSMANFSLTVTTWWASVLLSLTEMWKCCFLDLVLGGGMCNKCVGKKTDVQWQKEKNASANSFMFFFSSFFFGSYMRNAKPQITWTVLHSPTEIWITFILFHPYIFFHLSLCMQSHGGSGASPTSTSLYTTTSVYSR